MSKQKPLSYASLKAVIENMDPNLRVLLSVKLPSIRHAEKATPMRLDELQISETDISLKKNSYSHRMKVMRYINGMDGFRPYEACGVPYSTDYDVDEYGIQDMPLIPTPGDLDFGNNANRLRTEEQLRRIVSFPLISQDPLASTDLKDLEMRRDNVESPYTFFIHLSNICQTPVIYREKELVIEKVDYNQNLSIAIKYFIQKLLGGKQQGGPIKVKNLHLSCKSRYLRLPIGLELDVQNLFVFNNKNGLSIIRPLLAPQWSSLESITVENLENRDREILSSVGTVGVSGLLHRNVELPYRRMKFSQSLYQYQQYINIAKNLKVTQPRVGSHYTFTLWDTPEELMKIMNADDNFEKGQLPESKVFHHPECYVLPINNRSEVLIYFSYDPTDYRYASFRFKLEMEVQPRAENFHN
ncbi:hypothetical protein CRE_14687 [Caenorhabditis remanei]|uniref:Uncharacterized protein n=1 Tax=Caenorhabditis remanei TaxID=31234 RepID=E3M9K8_CAERE|nr:hypothetical protein CRE_14687 [Caenorhabditis remanei]